MISTSVFGCICCSRGHHMLTCIWCRGELGGWMAPEAAKGSGVHKSSKGQVPLLPHEAAEDWTVGCWCLQLCARCHLHIQKNITCVVKEDTQMNILLVLSPRMFSNLSGDMNESVLQQGRRHSLGPESVHVKYMTFHYEISLSENGDNNQWRTVWGSR